MSRKRQARRSGCPISFGLDMFGDAWTLLLLRDLLLKGKRRFREFASAGEGIATNILSDRLDLLLVSGLAERESDEADRRQIVYRPTDRARSLIPALVELAYWGACHDPLTDAPPEFRLAYQADRAGLIASLDAASRE